MLLTFMRRRRSATLLAAFVLLPSSACIDLGKDYVEKQQYVLEVELPGRSISPTTIDEIIAVRTFTAGPGLEDPGLVYRTADVRYESDFYNEFFVPPSELVTSAVRKWMRAAHIFRAVVDPGSLEQADYVIDGCVTKLYGDYREQPRACLEIQLFLTHYGESGPEIVFHKTYSETEPAEAKKPDELVAAFNRALVRILKAWEAEFPAGLR